ncbi:MAG: Rrf2 family transcriptional regulator [Eubacteriaceae bacterium]|nr:Rrf2 family transcriptional regulator [Eubacteriaceae bacterium]
MKISAKGKYGLAAMIFIAQQPADECITVLRISETLDISKIYLEQVFALLKKAELVISIKGSSGGYRLSKQSKEITAFDILNAVDVSLFETTDKNISDKASYISKALDEILWKEFDNTIVKYFTGITLYELADASSKNQAGKEIMYYI